jgi:RNA polymerase sigma-70 factor (ECF subfamily)
MNDDPSPLRAVNETVRMAQQGDAEAFRALYEANVGRVYAVCLRFAGDRGTAEEHTQDVFVRAWQRLHTFRGESAFSTWLYRLTVNEVLQARRAGGRRSARVSYTDEPEKLPRLTPSAPARATDLERAIAALPEGARTVFVLYDVEGYQHEEIARLTGIAEGTSKAQLHRARRLLREALER